MVTLRVWVSLLLLLALLPGVASAQLERRVDEQGTIYYTTPPGEPPPAPRGARIPFTPGAPILVSAKINGGEAVTLILDTGADQTMVTPQALGKLGIPLDQAHRQRIKGVGGIVDAGVAWVNSVEVGDAKTGPLQVVVHDADLRQADGLLGRDFLDRFTVTIDAKESVVTLEPK